MQFWKEVLPWSDYSVTCRITSCRGHACLVTPPSAFCGEASSDSLVFGGTYLRDAAGEGIVMGCGASSVREHHLAGPEELYGVEDDSYIVPKIEQCGFSPPSRSNWTFWTLQAD